MKRLRNAQGGFTLMELMVVIVIVAILAAVAVPLYINYVNDARDTEAKGAIGAVITAQQAFYQTHNNQYAPQGGGSVTLTKPSASNNGGLNCDVSDALLNWTIVSATTGTGFTVTATSIITGYTSTVKYTYPPTGGGVDPWTVTH